MFKRIFTAIFIGLAVSIVSTFVLKALAAPPTSPYNPGETLNPSCAPGDTNCTVVTPAMSNAVVSSLTGTSNQVNVSSATGTVVLSLPQSIATSSSPTFANLIISASSTLGTIISGIWQGTAIENNYIASSTYWNAKQEAITLATSTSGTDFSITNANPTWTFNLPSATSTTRGLLTASDWTSFNNKVSTSTLTSYVPYTGATTTVNLGSQALTTTGTGTFGVGRFTTSIKDNAATPLISIDTGTRKLYASDGSTLGLDYSTVAALSGAGAGTPRIDSNFFGRSAGALATSATDSNFFGYFSGYGAIDANNSNFFGNAAGSDASAANNSNFFGGYSGVTATNANNSNFFGAYVGYHATNASFSNFFGQNAGNSATNASNSNFFGADAGRDATSASNANFFGEGAGYGATKAKESIFIGSYSGVNDTVDNTVSGTSIAIGKYSGTGGFKDSVSIGHGVINSAVNEMNLGNVMKLTGIYASDTPSSTLVIGATVSLGTNAFGAGAITGTSFNITLASSTTGTDFSITNSNPTWTFNLPSATSTTRGLLTAADWSAFNSKLSSYTETDPVYSANSYAVGMNQSVATSSSPTFAGLSLGSGNFLTTGTLGAGAITGTSFTIGANTLTTSEWAYLDGQNQAVRTTSNPIFANIILNQATISLANVGSSPAALLVESDPDVSPYPAQFRIRNKLNTRFRADWIVGQGGGSTLNSYDDVASLYQNFYFDSSAIYFNLRNAGAPIISAGTILPSEDATYDLGIDIDNRWNNVFAVNYYAETAYFRDTALSIASLDDGHLDLTADISIDLNATTTARTILPATTNTYSLGSASYKWANLYAATTTVGDLVFANDFRITEADASSTPQVLIFKNQNGEEIMKLDENGNLTIAGQFNASSTQAQSASLGFFDNLAEKIKETLSSFGMIIENGIAKFQELTARKITIEGDLEVTGKIKLRDQATGEIYCVWIENGEWQKQKGNCEPPVLEPIQTSTPEITPEEPTPEPEPEPEPEITPEPESPTPEPAPVPAPEIIETTPAE